jgi:hypothetical protein
VPVRQRARVSELGATESYSSTSFRGRCTCWSGWGLHRHRERRRRG